MKWRHFRPDQISKFSLLSPNVGEYIKCRWQFQKNWLFELNSWFIFYIKQITIWLCSLKRTCVVVKWTIIWPFMFKIQHLKYVRLGVKLFYLESDLLCLLFGFKYECKSHSGDESLDGTPIHRYLVWSIIASFCRHSNTLTFWFHRYLMMFYLPLLDICVRIPCIPPKN